MNNIIKNFKTHPLVEMKFVRPMKLTYNQNGVDRQWEAVKSFDSVAVLIYHEEKKSFLLVKQFRPPVYMNDNSRVCTYELCAGLVDKDIDLDTIVQEEIDEECGYKVPLENIQRITGYFTNVGVSGGQQSFYFATINESMKAHEGGGIHDEEIETYLLPIGDIDEFIFDESKAKTPGLMFSFLWFRNNYKDEFL